jgi:hypothetical protein
MKDAGGFLFYTFQDWAKCTQDMSQMSPVKICSLSPKVPQLSVSVHQFVFLYQRELDAILVITYQNTSLHLGCAYMP